MKFTALVMTPTRCCLLAVLAHAAIMPVAALPSLEGAPNLRSTIPDERSVRQNSFDTDQAVAIAERRYNGRAVGARHLGNGLYRVRILQADGKVKTVTVRPD